MQFKYVHTCICILVNSDSVYTCSYIHVHTFVHTNHFQSITTHDVYTYMHMYVHVHVTPYTGLQ